jgi:SAM-dependent methyltransferase
MPPIDSYRETIRANWDSRVDIHYRSDDYGVDRYVSDPAHLSGVVRFDSQKLGDVEGKRLLHLQCHIGTDTISWARLGATVTGVDFSGKSIDAARRLSRDSNTPARFLVSELYDSPGVLDETFDVVYTGVGAVNWLPDIRGWAEVVSGFLDRGGVFYMREGHPIAWALDFSETEDLVIRYPYFEQAEPFAWSEDTTYAGDGTLDSPDTYEWSHGMAETVQALIDAGLRIDRIEEYDSCEWQMLPQMIRCDDGLWRLPEGRERLPFMWSVLATKATA